MVGDTVETLWFTMEKTPFSSFLILKIRPVHGTVYNSNSPVKNTQWRCVYPTK
jgi:hypothetical protein